MWNNRIRSVFYYKSGWSRPSVGATQQRSIRDSCVAAFILCDCSVTQKPAKTDLKFKTFIMLE